MKSKIKKIAIAGSFLYILHLAVEVGIVASVLVFMKRKLAKKNKIRRFGVS